ncbi:hypothetical protein T10_1019 [Trichinella papuae]|uniref:Uncharacterized protein n=1 Tax=Trichinella papuae TaxID=268474 RepID=A0A0V1N057_9BILA|nr:hypothetical protein T10_1019 [Trichinella papuae]
MNAELIVMVRCKEAQNGATMASVAGSTSTLGPGVGTLSNVPAGDWVAATRYILSEARICCTATRFLRSGTFWKVWSVGRLTERDTSSISYGEPGRCPCQTTARSLCDGGWTKARRWRRNMLQSSRHTLTVNVWSRWRRSAIYLEERSTCPTTRSTSMTNPGPHADWFVTDPQHFTVSR